MNEEFNPDIVSLSDEEGNEYTFEVLDAIETDDSRYVALMPVQDDENEADADDSDLVILKEFTEENGESYYEEIEDDNEYDTIADAFVERLQDFFEIEED